MRDRSFESALVPVSGAASGIGLAVCQQLRDEGAMPLLIDRDAGRLAHAVDRVYAGVADPARYAYTVDVSDAAAVNACFDCIRRDHGLVTHGVASAGIVGPGHILSLSDADWRQVMSVNLDGVMHFCRAAARHLAERRSGALVNLASIAGGAAKYSRSAYSASKAGVVNLTRALAMDLGEFGVRVNAVAPGVIDTPMQTGGSIGIAGRGALKRLGHPDEVAQAIVFLLSDRASYITGQTLAVDGGVSATYA